MTKYITVHSWKVMIATCIILIFLRNNENIPQNPHCPVAPWVATCRQFNDDHCIHWLIKYFQLMFYTSCDPYFSYIHAANRFTIINHAGKEVVLRWIFRYIFTATGTRVKGEIMDMTNGVNFPLTGAAIDQSQQTLLYFSRQECGTLQNGRALLRNILRKECIPVFDSFGIKSRHSCGRGWLHIVEIMYFSGGQL